MGERYKTCFIAKGLNQKYAINYLETFVIMTKMIAILCLTIRKYCQMFQLDVKNIFLNGDLDKKFFISLRSGYEEYEKCCKLNKTLYELKQPICDLKDSKI